MSTQNTDGGWGFYKGDDSNVYMTALVSYTLQQFSETLSLATAINKATTYLIAHQNTDGGFGSSPSTVFESSYAYMALTNQITDNTVLGNAVNYLQTTQLADGSWDDDPYSTALALRALYMAENRQIPVEPPPVPTTGTVSGQIIDISTKQPLSNVTVASGQLSAATTNTGNFTLPDMPLGSQTITFSLAGYSYASATVTITAGSVINIGTISLAPNPTSGMIKGTVTDASTNQPLEGVSISVTGSFTGTSVTGADGSFIMANVTPGSVTLSATKSGYTTVNGTGTVNAGGILFFSPKMTALTQEPAKGTITGRVVDSTTGQPVSGVFVELLSNGATVNTDGTGSFTLANVPPGSQTIFFAMAGYTDVTITANVVEGSITNLGTIAFSPNPTTGVIRGTVTDAGNSQPITGVTVAISGPSTGSFTTGSDGRFIFTGVNPGVVTITVTKTGYLTVTGTVSVVACSISTINVQMTATSPQTGTIKGTITDAANGQPLSGVTINVSASGSYNRSATTGADGSYILSDITPGDFAITISKAGYKTVTGSGTINAGGTLVVSPKLAADGTSGTRLVGRVVDCANDHPVSGVTVSLAGVISTTTDAQGLFLIDNVAPGTYQLSISTPGYISQQFQVMITEGNTTDLQTIRITQIHTSTTIRGRVTDAAAGNPITGATVAVVGAALSSTTNTNGEYAITGIDLLQFELRASAAGYDSLAYGVSTSDFGVYTNDFALHTSQVSDISIKSVTADKAEYHANEDVLITAELENLGSTDAHLVVTANILDSTGNVIAIASTGEAEIVLLPAESGRAELRWNTGQFPPESYYVVLTIRSPETGGYKNAEKATSLSIMPTPMIWGAIALSPPATQANMQTPIAITAALRNTGNIPVSGNVILEATFNGAIVYQQEQPIGGLDVNSIQEFDFGSFIPQDGGNYSITLRPSDSSIGSDIGAKLHVGDYAKATFAVIPEKAVIGNAHVKGKVALKGIASSSGTVQDPLVPLMKAAIQKGVYWEQTNAMNWQNGSRCYGCHVQTQSLIGMELSRDKVAVNDDTARQFLNYMGSCQKTAGFLTHNITDTTESAPIESTTLFAWSLSQYHEGALIQAQLSRALDYLITRQNTIGYWVSDYYYGSNDWWSDLGSGQPSTPFTAYNVISLAKLYKLSGVQKYKDSMFKAVNYLKGADHTRSIITASHIMIGLESAYSYIDDPTLKTAVDNKITASISYLRSKQNADGGWGRYAGNTSDPLPTAHVLYAMSLAGVQGTDPGLRSGTTYLLNKQNPDGTWTTPFIRSNTYPDKYFAATTWAVISLPVTLETIAGVDADLTITLPQSVTFDHSSSIPTQSGATYHWDFKGLTDDGKELLLDLTLNGLQLGEERKIASDAYLSFTDTYTGTTINLPVEIPSVTGVSPVAIDVETDKEVYHANEPVIATTTVNNISPEMRSPTIRMTVEDMDGNVVDDIADFQIENLNPSFAAPFLYGWGKRVKLTVDHTKVDSDLTNLPVRIHLGSSSGISRADLSSIFSELAIAPNDEFSGETGNSPDINRWNVLYYATISNNQLRIPSSGGYRYVQSKFKLGGDFDIQVDYGFDVYPGSQNGWEAIFKILDNGDQNRQMQISRRYDGTHSISFNKRVSGSWGIVGTYNTAEQSGKFRLKREGDSFSGYFWDGSSWVLLGSFTYTGWTAGTLVEFAANSFTNNPQNVILLDNFRVNSGEIAYNGNRKKIAVTTHDGQTQCYAEIEKWDAINKEADFWVKAPALSSTADSVFFFYYDSSQPDNNQYVGDTSSTPAMNVWDSNYKAVYHFGEKTGYVLDSTSNQNYGAAYNFSDTEMSNASPIGNAYRFSGSEYVNLPDKPDFKPDHVSIEALVKVDAGNLDWARIYDRYHSPYAGYALGIDNYGRFRFHPRITGNVYSEANSLNPVEGDGKWHWVMGSYQDGYTKLHTDGNLDQAVATTNGVIIHEASETPRIGDGVYDPNFKGYISEIRISNIARSTAWHKASYNSINDNLITFGSPESINDADPSATKSYNFTWNAGSTLSGDYLVRAKLYENGAFLVEDTAQFKILADIGLTSKVVTDKISYQPNSSVTLTSTVSSTSANYIFENAVAKVTIADGQGQTLFTDTRPISVLTPGQMTEFKTYWNTGTYPSGAYPITMTVTDSAGSILSTGTTSLAIVESVKPSAALRGTISVDRHSLLQGDPVNISYSVTNVGNIDLSQVDLSVLTVHAVNQTAYDTLTDQAALTMGQTYANAQQLGTNNYTAKDYLVILRANIAGVEETLAGTYFRVEGAPSAPSLSSPSHGSDVVTLTPVLVVNNASDPNDDRLTYEFELYADAGLTELAVKSAVLAEEVNITSWQVPVELQENNVYYWRARAYDGLLYGEWMTPAAFRVNVANDPPTAPTLSSPADSSEVDNLTPLLVVGNASDPDSVNLTYNFELALDEGFTQVVSSGIGIFEGEGTTSWQVPVELNDNTWYYWRSQADDWLDVGPWMSTARFFVNTVNDAPSAPAIISPSSDGEIIATNADIVASNAVDLDNDTLTYLFELDTVNTFDSSNIMRSGSIPEGQGTNSWRIEGLNDNTSYYVRAKANDGLADSPWSEPVTFFVNTANDAPTTPVLANPSDGSGVRTFTPTLTIHNSRDVDRDILTYEFEIYDAANGSLMSTAGDVGETAELTSWTVNATLTENKTYRWRARAFDGELHSEWMPYASFMVNTANDAPSAPLLNAPADGISLDALKPTLSVYNAEDPDSDTLTYDFEVYSEGILIASITGIPQDSSGITSANLPMDLSGNKTYTWRARAYDGDRYGAWMDMATFSVHLPVTNITATINFDPDTLNQKSNGKWVTVYMELPAGYNVNDIDVASVRLNGTVPAEPWPYSIGDNDKDGIRDMMVKFNRNSVINILPNGDGITVTVTGTVGTTTFEGFDVIRVIK